MQITRACDSAEVAQSWRVSQARVSSVKPINTMPENHCDNPEHTPNPPAAKWAALINDTLVPMPARHVRAVVLRQQGGLPDEHALVRDHNSEDDPVMPTEGTINLDEGNVFYSVPACDAKLRAACNAPPKLAYTVDDHWEVVIRSDQTGRSLRDLFALGEDIDLLRDNESADDQVIGDGDNARFHDGCVFRTRKMHAALFIIVNKRRFTERDGVKAKMTGREIAALDSDQPDNTRVEKLMASGPVQIALDENVDVKCGDEFRVIRCNVNAGFQHERVQRELALLREGGACVTLIEGPVPAVIYHDIPVRAGLPLTSTNVLVKIPAGYPGGFLDNAFLPAESPLLNRTVGSAQQTENFDGQQWTQKSIHPHTGNGLAWDKDRHGLHTYYAEIQNWLHTAA